jgi:hypothetical protein
MTDFIPTTEHSVTGKPPAEGVSHLSQEAFPGPGETPFQTTVVAQAQFLTPTALSDLPKNPTTAEGGDKKTTPIVDQNPHSGQAGTAQDKVPACPGPIEEAQPPLTFSALNSTTEDQLKLIEKLGAQHTNQSCHMIVELDKADVYSQNDKSFLTAINLSDTLVVPTAEGGKAVLVGSFAATKHNGPGATYEDARGDKLKLEGDIDEKFHTKFMDGYTVYGMPNGDTVLDNFGNVFIQGFDNSEAIRTTDGRIYVKDVNDQIWYENNDPKVRVMTPDQIKEMYASKEAPCGEID